ncbi:MAG: hypothetical protein ACREOP_06310 [Thermodesulfobacteriota bacterium]
MKEKQEWFLVGFQPYCDEGFAMRGEVSDTEAWIDEVIEDVDGTDLRLFDRDQLERMYLEIRRALYPDTLFDAEVICSGGVMELRSRTKSTSGFVTCGNPIHRGQSPGAVGAVISARPAPASLRES